ncbi:MAG: nucleotidyltransferase domain-containing protein [Bacteroidetes bacterium]|nr:MAG: nucleotidyltransferase domain-containing protein [Bacteroidota bacterium]
MLESKELNNLPKIKESILSVDPEAEVYLFGSRARKDNQKDSDWDLLILLSDAVTFDRKVKITSLLFDLELSENQLFNRIFFSRDEWMNNSLLHTSPFFREVINDYIPL